MSQKFDRLVVAYTEWVLRWRWLIGVAAVVLAGFIASGGRYLGFDTSYRAFFSRSNPQLNAFEALQNIYTKNDNILFVFAPAERQIFTSDNLALIEEFVQEAWTIPYAIRVDAVTNFQHTEAFDDDLFVHDLVENAGSFLPDDLTKAKSVALREPQLLNRLVSPGTEVTGVNVTFQFPEKDSQKEVPEAVNYARDLASKFQGRSASMKTYLTGVVMLNNAFSEAGINDLSTLVPLMYLTMFLIMFVVLRSVSGTVATIMVVFLSTVTAMGVAGWFKVGLTPPSAQAPTMIMTLAIADSIHILVIMLREMRRGLSKNEAIVESLRINMTPVFLTSLTTAIGFLSMNLSDAPPFWHLGNITAVGVSAAFLYSVLFLPALMSILPVKAPKRATPGSAFFERFAEFVIAKRSPLLWGSAAVVLLLAAFLPRNVLNDQFVNYFGKRIQFRQDTDFTMQNLTGLYQVEFSLGTEESGGISEPHYLEKLDEFEAWLKQQPEVVHVSSFSQVMKRVNKSMNGDDTSYYRIPESRELAAQYLLLYELSLPYGLDLNNQINVDKSATRFSVTLSDLSSVQLREFAARTQQWLKDNAPSKMFSYGVGPAVMFANISGRNILGMLKSTTAALILISFSLILALRSFKFGGLSLIPNLVPAAMAFGIWGLTVGQINIALSMVTGMTLGIIVDDSVHFLTKYLRARREKKLAPHDAVRYAFSSVGVALLVTSIIMVAGFAILTLSSFEMNAGMGRLTALTIVLALIADFLFLPPLLMKVEEKSQAAAVKGVGQKEEVHFAN
jgi:predicted RND superfamily exporter protein